MKVSPERVVRSKFDIYDFIQVLFGYCFSTI
jgi:hypothetical protein